MIRLVRRTLNRLGGDRRGATIIEFAIVTPVMMALMMGLGDLLYQEYAQALLEGSVQKAGRDSAIQGGDTAATTIDAKVVATVRQIAKNANYSITRKNYDTFSEVAPEPFTDTNNNGVRDPGECFTDVNGNKTWDADPGAVGQGGASDVTTYTVMIIYPHLFPVAGLLGWGANATITAQTLLKNQPYQTQTITAPTTVCT